MTYNAEVLADSPLGYWRLGELSGTTAVDASGNGRDGTYAGSVTLGANGAISNDTCLTITGNTGRGLVTGAAWMDVATWTVEAWVNLTGTDKRLVTREARVTPVSSNYIWSLQSLSGKLTPVVFSSGSAKVYNSTASIADGLWHQVAVSWDGTTLRMYVDGQPSGTGTPGGTLARNTTSDIVFGNAHATAATDDLTYGRTGSKVDEVAFYSGALSAARILAHYEAAVDVFDVVAPAATGALVVDVSVVTGTFDATAAAATSALSLDNGHHFDVSNAHNLRQRTMRCNVEITVPIAPVPPGVSEAERHDAIITYPLPDMDNGRPT